MATTAGIINGCVSSSTSAPSSSLFGKLRGSRKKTTTTSTPANGGADKRFRSCCISASSVASDPYKILRIRPGASESEVKTAFRQLALKYHPDVCKDQDCGIQFQNIIEAYDMVMGDLRGETSVGENEMDDGPLEETTKGMNDPDWEMWEEWMGWEGAGIHVS
ncbi:hypothetical protein R6Q57_018659 [Mikania cordata]